MSVYTTFKLILCVINIILTNVQKIWDELRDAKTMKTIVKKKINLRTFKSHTNNGHHIYGNKTGILITGTLPLTGILSKGIQLTGIS